MDGVDDVSVRAPASRFAVCENVLRQGDLPRNAQLAQNIGAHALGVEEASVLACGPDRARQALAEHGLAASSIFSSASILGSAQERSHDAWCALISLAGALDAPTVLVVTGPGSHDRSADERACRAWFERYGPIAADNGTRLALEPLHPIFTSLTFVHTFAHAADLIGGAPGAGVAVDTGHLWWERGWPATVTRQVELVATVQVSDVSTEALGRVTYERTAPGAGVVDVAAALRGLDAAGYGGWYEDEVLVREPREGKADRLRARRAYFCALWSDVEAARP